MVHWGTWLLGLDSRELVVWAENYNAFLLVCSQPIVHASLDNTLEVERKDVTPFCLSDSTW